MLMRKRRVSAKVMIVSMLLWVAVSLYFGAYLERTSIYESAPLAMYDGLTEIGTHIEAASIITKLPLLTR